MSPPLKNIDSSLDSILSSLRIVVREAVRAELDDQLLSVRDAAEFAGFSQTALRKHLERGHIPFVLVGKRIRIRRSDLVAANDRSGR